MALTPEARQIVKALKANPKAHIHYFDNMMWSMYPNKKQFELYWEEGNGNKDLLEIEIMQGDDFDSTYLSPLVEAMLYMSGKSGSSI